jgi:hypothetical protein
MKIPDRSSREADSVKDMAINKRTSAMMHVRAAIQRLGLAQALAGRPLHIDPISISKIFYRMDVTTE